MSKLSSHNVENQEDLTKLQERHKSNGATIEKLKAHLVSSGLTKGYLNVRENELSAVGKLPDNIFSETDQHTPTHRLVRLRIVPWDSWPYAQLYYTGSSAFNLYLREKAARLGYKLAPDHLQKSKKAAVEVFGVDGLRFMDDNTQPYKEGKWVILDSEEDIFRFLQLKYVHPFDRNL